MFKIVGLSNLNIKGLNMINKSFLDIVCGLDSPIALIFRILELGVFTIVWFHKDIEQIKQQKQNFSGGFYHFASDPTCPHLSVDCTNACMH